MAQTTNPCAKSRKVNDPYETWVNDYGWEFRVLKKYQNPEREASNQYARWLCAVKSPDTYNSYDVGDTYVRDVKKNAELVPNTGEAW
jgi:hypothetical protein